MVGTSACWQIEHGFFRWAYGAWESSGLNVAGGIMTASRIWLAWFIEMLRIRRCFVALTKKSWIIDSIVSELGLRYSSVLSDFQF